MSVLRRWYVRQERMPGYFYSLLPAISLLSLIVWLGSQYAPRTIAPSLQVIEYLRASRAGVTGCEHLLSNLKNGGPKHHHLVTGRF